MIVSDDEFELPLAVAGSMKELATMTGRSEKTVRSMFCKLRRGEFKKSSYVVVDIESEDDD